MTCLSVCLPICLFVCLSICFLFVCLSVCLFAYVCMSVCHLRSHDIFTAGYPPIMASMIVSSVTGAGIKDLREKIFTVASELNENPS